MNLRRGWRSFFTSSLTATAIFLALLWSWGFPQPTADDLFYSGAALNLASGGDFSNPLLERQGFPSHYFFVYPPLQSFVLAGWLKLFGISAWSLMGFAMALLFLICAATVAILRRYESPIWLEWLVPLGVCFAFLPTGLRPEALAVCLAMIGFAIAEWHGGSGLGLFTGFLLMFLGASCAPRMTCFAGALAVCAGFKAWRNPALNYSGRWISVALAGAGLLMSGLAFLLLINFRLGEFWQTFHFHAARVSGKQLDILKDYIVSFLGFWQWPLVLIPLGLLVYALCKPKNGLSITAIFIAAAFVGAGCAGGIGFGTIWWFILLMLLLAGSAAKSLSGGRMIPLQVAVILALLIANRRLEANCLGILSGNISLNPGDQYESARQLRSTKENPLLLDGAAARYVFDYKIPEGALDLNFGTRFPGTLPGDLNSGELRPGDIFLAGPDNVQLLVYITYLDQQTPKWLAFGRNALKFEKYPRWVYVIPAENCKSSRPSPGKTKIWLPKSAQ